ncbi:MAG TPA: N,N-dimethylformamidase beta subunit family domain-containing protein [Bryobacteraceae bacterium]
MNLIAYVSDENYLALAGVHAEFRNRKDGSVAILSSSACGAFYADLPDGEYRVTLAKDGYGAKWVNCELEGGKPRQFRLLSDSVLGYMWPKWTRSGERSEIRAHSPEQFQLTIWRYGLKKEYAGMLSWFDEHGPRTTVQITPDDDYSQTGVDWNRHGYPSAHVQQFVTAPARSGLYYLWARTPSGRTFSFPWIVAPSQPRAKVAVLASSNTWNAYNNFGGRSNYINPGGLPDTPTVNARQDLSRYTTATSVWTIPDRDFKPLSFERPEPGNHIFDNSPWDGSSITDSIQGRMQCGLAPGEWRLLGWLEREGFEYDYYAEAQLHDGSLPLDSYGVLILSVHPEYWTREMFRRVKQWVAKGGRLMYLGGNGLNCEVTLEANAVMRCLSYDDTDDPKSGHESRMHRTYESEAGLLGVAFTDPGVMTSAPYRVIDDSHWVFEGTGLRKGDLFGEKSLHERVPGGASGHETDKITASSPARMELLAKGTNPNDGGAELVHFTSGSGAVFSAGSITWVSALFPDERVSRVTRNVLERFLQMSTR